MTDKQRQRIHDIEYSCDSRAELAERIVALEDKLAMYENDHQITLCTYGSWKRLKAEVPKLREENAKLVDVLHEVEEEAVLAYHGLQSDIELLIKSETEFFEKWWHSECRNDNKLKRIEVLDAENAKLREELAQWERLTAGIELPEYPITEFEPKDLERENAKLRELVDYMTPIAWYAASERERDRMRELGVEL